jgi:hypothetical protein
MPSCVQVISTNSTSRISMEARPTWSVHMVVTYNMPLVGLPWITLDYLGLWCNFWLYNII